MRGFNILKGFLLCFATCVIVCASCFVSTIGVSATVTKPKDPENIELYKYVYGELKQHKDKIDISKFDFYICEATCDPLEYRYVIGDISQAINYEYIDIADLGYFKYEYTLKNGGYYATYLLPVYYEWRSQELFDQETEKILSTVDPNMTDLQKVIYLHDYLCSTTMYDRDKIVDDSGEKSDDNYQAYGTIVNKVGVCEGFAAAYKYLLNKLGIECYIVKTEKAWHAWNMVVIDGEAYHVDMTMDQHVSETLGGVYHQGLLCSDAEMMDDFMHEEGVPMYYNDYVDIKATSERFKGAFWKSEYIQGMLFLYNGNYYYQEGQYTYLMEYSDFDLVMPKVMKHSATKFSGDGTQIPVQLDLSVKWVADQSKLFNSIKTKKEYVNTVVLDIKDGRIWYTTFSGISSMKLDGTDLREEYRIDVTKEFVCAAAKINGEYYYENINEYTSNYIGDYIKLDEKYNVNKVKEPKKGDILKNSKASFVVTAYSSSSKTVAYKAPSKKTFKIVTVPDTVTIDGVKYKVTSISANAFKNNKKLVKVTIGKNVTSIGKNAFYGCKNLKTIIIKSIKFVKSKIGAYAFKGINRKAVFKVPKSKHKAYAKIFKKYGKVVRG